VIELKRHRRVSVGERVTLLFENRETLRFQVQEMLRVERIHAQDAVQAELDVYNELMPRPGELSATLFIEITDTARIKPELDRLVGLDAHVSLVLGEGPGERAARASFDPRQRDEERISAVQYVRFPLEPALRVALGDAAVRARLRIDHPAYRCETEVSPPLRAQLLADLTPAEPEPLLRVRSAAPGAPSEEVLLETDVARVLRLAGAETIAVVCRTSVSLTEAEPGLLAALMEIVQTQARDLARRHGACRIVCDVGPGAAPMRWLLLPRER